MVKPASANQQKTYATNRNSQCCKIPIFLKILERLLNATLHNVTIPDDELKGFVTHNPDLWFYQVKTLDISGTLVLSGKDIVHIRNFGFIR
jgi:hypothetical protein